MESTHYSAESAAPHFREYHILAADLFSAIWESTRDGLTGSAWGDRANYTASQLRGPESKLGVQAAGLFGVELDYHYDSSPTSSATRGWAPHRA